MTCHYTASINPHQRSFFCSRYWLTERPIPVQCSQFSPNWDLYIMPLLPKLKDCHGGEDKKDARVSGIEWLDWKSVFQTQQGSFAHELTACIITVQVQNIYKSLHGMGGVPTKSRPLLRSYWQLIVSGKVSSLEGCGPWKVDHAPVVTQELLDCANWTQWILFF